MDETNEQVRQTKSGRTLIEELDEIATRCASRPVLSDATADEVLGYDEHGVPGSTSACLGGSAVICRPDYNAPHLTRLAAAVRSMR